MGNPYGYAWRQLSQQAKRIYPPICHLCRGDIDMSLTRRDAYSWTLDHLNPVAQYGDTLPDISEVRPAHKWCNSKRGDRDLPAAHHTEEW